MNKWLRWIAPAAALITASASAAAAPATPAAGQSSRAQIEAVVRDLLEREPELVEAALQALAKKQETQRAASARAKVLADGRHFAAGPKTAPTVMIEFFDYQCGYCKAALPFTSAAARSPAVRSVYVELPVQGPVSDEAAKAAVASIRQGKYLQMHQGLLAARGRLSSTQIDAIAKKAGLDVARLRKDMQDPAIAKLLAENRALAGELGVAGTPFFVINDELVEGFDEARLRSLAKLSR